MKMLFMGLMLLFTVSSGIATAGWWGNDNDEDKDEDKTDEDTVVEETVTPPEKTNPIPFDVCYLKPYVQEDYYCDCDSVVKKTNYIMEMKPTKGPWGQSMKTRDRHLGLKIKINMLGQVWEKPVECIITHGNALYASKGIWACRVSASKMVYVVSFKETNSFLVIYKPKKSLWKAQWAYLDSK